MGGLLRGQVERFLSFEGENAARIVNNLDWTAPLSAIDFLRDIGKYFRVGTMLKKDAVSARLNSEAGISYTEFSYQILQGLDYLELHRQYGCVLQTGGSDQWGKPHERHRSRAPRRGGLGARHRHAADHQQRRHEVRQERGQRHLAGCRHVQPLGHVPVLAEHDDRDVIERLKVFTFLTRTQIEEYEGLVASEPFRRAAQKRLAREVLTTVHGVEATEAVIAATEALFGQGDVTVLDAAVLRSALEELPHATVAAGTTVVEALTATGLCASLSEARRAISQGGVSLDGEKVTSDEAVVARERCPAASRCCAAERRRSRGFS